MSDLRNASVLVTGASGFLGSRMVRHLTGRTRRLVALARGSATVVHPMLRDVEVIVGDVSVPAEIRTALTDIDVVIHLAGRSGAASSVEDPLHDLSANVGGLITLLEAVRAQERPIRVVFPGSRLQYGSPKALPVLETDPLRPISPYGAAKCACEAYLDLYSRLHGISYAVARLTNPYGPSVTDGRKEYNVLNRLIARACAGGALTIYGDGKQLRDYVYVDDVALALEVLAQCDENIIANVGSGVGVSMRSTAQCIVRMAGRGSVKFVPWPKAAAQVETGDFVADISRMRALGWAPSVALDDGIQQTIELSGDRR